MILPFLGRIEQYVCVVLGGIKIEAGQSFVYAMLFVGCWKTSKKMLSISMTTRRLGLQCCTFDRLSLAGKQPLDHRWAHVEEEASKNEN